MKRFRSQVAACANVLAFGMIVSACADETNEPFELIREDAVGSIQASVTNREMAETPISPILCSNFIEAEFGYQVEGMWSEMLYNRSFEKWVPLRPNSARWYDLLAALSIAYRWTTMPNS